MPTPRPPGVRRANVFEEQFVLHVTSAVHARRLNPKSSSGFAPLAFAHSASATLPSPANPRKSLSRARFIGSGNVVNRRPLGASLSRALVSMFARRPGAQS